MKITKKYTFFWKAKIAQWHKSDFKDDESIIYNCAEQYMMAKKALLFNDTQTYEKIMKEDNPAIHQKLGREVKNFDLAIWNKERENIVYQGNYYKFTQNRELFEILTKTPNTIFVEASPYDKIWGVGLSEDDPLILNEYNWKGQNLLGKVLTQLRDDLIT